LVCAGLRALLPVLLSYQDFSPFASGPSAKLGSKVSIVSVALSLLESYEFNSGVPSLAGYLFPWCPDFPHPVFFRLAAERKKRGAITSTLNQRASELYKN